MRVRSCRPTPTPLQQLHTVSLLLCRRVGGPLVLRQLLNWLSGYEASDGNTEVGGCAG